MMPYSRALIYFFSGTGNTYLVAKKIRDVLNENGLPTDLLPLAKADPVNANPDRLIGIGFPVAVHSTYPVVLEFIRRMPVAKSGCSVFLFSTLAGTASGAIGSIVQILKRKGYRVIAAREITMPRNFWMTSSDLDLRDGITEKGLSVAAAFAGSLLIGDGKIPSAGKAELFFMKLVNTPLTWSICRLAYPLSLRKESCSKCKICSRICPVGNITMQDYPTIGKNCQICMRCVSYCPSRAIELGHKQPLVHQGVPVSEILSSRL
jgi:flavodoxin/ferredoxin